MTSLDDPAATVVPAELARAFGVVPVAVDDERVTLASAGARDHDAATAVEALTGRSVRFVPATRADVEAGLVRVYGPPPEHRAGRVRPPDPVTTHDPEFARRLAASAGLEFSELEDPDREVDRDAAALLGEELSRRFGTVALTQTRTTVRVAVSQPFDDRVLTLVEAVTALRPQQVVAPAHRIAAALDHAFASPQRTQELGPIRVETRAFPRGQRLGEVLLAEGAIDRRSLRRALAIQRRTGDPLGRILVSLGLVAHDRLAAAIARQLRIPHARDVVVDVKSAAAELIPEHLCRRHRLLPLELVDGTLVVAMADPLDPGAIDALRGLALPTRVVVASDDDIGANLERLHAELYTEISTTELLRRRPEESAYRVLTDRQRVALGVVLAAAATGLALAPIATLVALMLVSMVFYFSSSVYKFVLIYRTVGHAPEIPVSDTEVALLDESVLPRYTLLVPLYHEAVVARQLIDAIDGLDYPRSKLDVKLLLEEDDRETLTAVRATRLGPHFSTVIVPVSEPKTKPKACNYGLLHARGDFVVIYDAEDLPEPDQLKKAVIAFRKAPPGVVCVQAKLNYSNREQNLLTRWFTAEYSQWFDLFLPGLDATGAPIPLGGTSNHFRIEKLLELGAWDPFNVTEDADVGIRLARAGYRTAIMDSTTFEEANSRVYNWIRQRSRWVKGYIQTWLVHMRHPVRLWRELGPAGFASFQLVIGGTFVTMLLNPVFWALTSLWALSGADVIRQIFPGPVYFAAAFNLFVGNFVFTYLNVAGTIRRGYHDLAKYALLSPLYWALMSVGAWKGAVQLVTKPSYWEKTVHGLAEKP
jgi:cellulose synthase/poly-beta-1,6-N-acetylglucosamine synthase-like glycosyltransferase